MCCWQEDQRTYICQKLYSIVKIVGISPVKLKHPDKGHKRNEHGLRSAFRCLPASQSNQTHADILIMAVVSAGDNEPSLP
jgi:hypothetical protein